jgi:transcription elongation factor Elf1
MLKDCPHCGAEGSLETWLKIDLEDVVIGKNGEMVDFDVAGSANDPFNGIVVEESSISCSECGKRVDGTIPLTVTDRWTFTAITDAERLAREALATIDAKPPWQDEDGEGDSDEWGDEQDRSEWHEGEAGRLGETLRELANRVLRP